MARRADPATGAAAAGPARAQRGWRSFGSRWASVRHSRPVRVAAIMRRRFGRAGPRRSWPSGARCRQGRGGGGFGRGGAGAGAGTELDQTLEHAIHFLRRAQERVHREVVPELTELLREWLPRVTDERYVDVRMDPATLAVHVVRPGRGFPARRAAQPWHGGADLPAAAGCAHGTPHRGHDTCPLLLDDVTVHADPERTRPLLDLLHRLSGERQIVLFAHQDQVREWAYARFDGDRDALVELQPVGVGSAGAGLKRLPGRFALFDEGAERPRAARPSPVHMIWVRFSMSSACRKLGASMVCHIVSFVIQTASGRIRRDLAGGRHERAPAADRLVRQRSAARCGSASAASKTRPVRSSSADREAPTKRGRR